MMAKQKEDMDLQLQDLQQTVDDGKQFLEDKAQMVHRIDTLEKKCDAEKKLRLEQVNEKERDRIKETEQLRKEMLQSIKKTKANLLALNDEQLQTTTRLTILQNH